MSVSARRAHARSPRVTGQGRTSVCSVRARQLKSAWSVSSSIDRLRLGLQKATMDPGPYRLSNAYRSSSMVAVIRNTSAWPLILQFACTLALIARRLSDPTSPRGAGGRAPIRRFSCLRLHDRPAVWAPLGFSGRRHLFIPEPAVFRPRRLHSARPFRNRALCSASQWRGPDGRSNSAHPPHAVRDQFEAPCSERNLEFEHRSTTIH